MGCSTSRSTQGRRGRGSPVRFGQKTDLKINPTPPRGHIAGDTNVIHKRAANVNEDSRSLTLINPHAQDTEKRILEEKHYVVETEKGKDKSLTEPEHTPQATEQPESFEPENEKSDEPSNTNQLEPSKVDTETPIKEANNEMDQHRSKSPESTTVEVNTPRKDLNPAQDIQNEEITIERPPGSSEKKVTNSAEEITPDMINKSPALSFTPRSVEKGSNATTPAKEALESSNVEKEQVATPIEPSVEKEQIATPAKENIEESTVEKVQAATPAKEVIPDPGVESEQTVTPADIENASVSPVSEPASPHNSTAIENVANDSSAPIQENTELTVDTPGKATVTPIKLSGTQDDTNPELSPTPENDPHELTTITPEAGEETIGDAAQQEAEEIAKDTNQPIEDNENKPTLDDNSLPIDAGMDSPKKEDFDIKPKGGEDNTQIDTQEASMIEETKDNQEGAKEMIDQESPDSKID